MAVNNNFILKSDRELIDHSLVWVAYLAIFGIEGSELVK